MQETSSDRWHGRSQTEGRTDGNGRGSRKWTTDDDEEWYCVNGAAWRHGTQQTSTNGLAIRFQDGGGKKRTTASRCSGRMWPFRLGRDRLQPKDARRTKNVINKQPESSRRRRWTDQKKEQKGKTEMRMNGEGTGSGSMFNHQHKWATWEDRK